ncbi:MAG: dTMP kinase [Bacteroidales bacterium]|nr:dTMP kinase [Candidatus Latescibacterota bacterium]
MSGFFMTFEGIEGSGKSTVARLVADELKKAGIDILLTREPGGTRTSEAIRSILLDPDRAEISARAELLMYLASRSQLVDEVISPALRGGRTVICDRFMDASVAYQGWARGLGEKIVEDLNSFTVGEFIPDMTFLFDLPVETGFSRGPEKRESDGVRIKDRLEREARSFHEKVREGYLRIAEREPGRFVVIDAALSLQEVTVAVLGNIRPHLDVQF